MFKKITYLCDINKTLIKYFSTINIIISIIYNFKLYYIIFIYMMYIIFYFLNFFFIGDALMSQYQIY